MRQLVDNRFFALAELLLVMVSAAAWILTPQLGIWLSLMALLPWYLRFLVWRPPFQRTRFDWLIALFLATAWIGYWAAYDKSAAWVKVWLIVSAILLFYAVVAQPKQNLEFLSFLSFCFALALSLYFSLTYDFAGMGGRFGTWWTNQRPHVDWPTIHPGYVSGLLLLSSIFAVHWLWNATRKAFGSAAGVLQLVLLSGMGLVALMFVLTLSGGTEVLVLGAIGLILLWRVSLAAGSSARARVLFPILVTGYLFVLIAAAYFGQARTVLDAAHSDYGMNSRAALLGRSSYLLSDFPFTGAGLASFPGAYSQYILVIPFFYFINSYNLFLDVAIEQGFVAGAILLTLYFGTVLQVSHSIVNHPRDRWFLMKWLKLVALIVTVVHGFFYDYLYQGSGTALLFYPLGMALAGMVSPSSPAAEGVRQPGVVSARKWGIPALLLAAIVVLAFNQNRILSIWYANLGAVQMSRAELNGFPTSEWATSELLPRLQLAESTLQSALSYQKSNPTANHRLGLISMLRQDFAKAASNLEMAYQQAPGHRGIIKNLGYCYVWLGKLEKARTLLAQIPEAQQEMKVYIWWWETQGRPDLAENAAQMASLLSTNSE